MSHKFLTVDHVKQNSSRPTKVTPLPSAAASCWNSDGGASLAAHIANATSSGHNTTGGGCGNGGSGAATGIPTFGAVRKRVQTCLDRASSASPFTTAPSSTLASPDAPTTTVPQQRQQRSTASPPPSSDVSLQATLGGGVPRPGFGCGVLDLSRLGLRLDPYITTTNGGGSQHRPTMNPPPYSGPHRHSPVPEFTSIADSSLVSAKAVLDFIADVCAQGEVDTLCLNNNQDLGDGGVRLLMETYMPRWNHIHTLELFDVGLTDAGLLALGAQLATTRVRRIKVGENPFGGAAFRQFCDLITQGQLEAPTVQVEGAPIVTGQPPMTKGLRLEQIHLGGSHLGRDGAIGIATLLRECPLAHLGLRGMSLAHGDMTMLCEALVASSTITHLQLRENDLTDISLQKLTVALQRGRVNTASPSQQEVASTTTAAGAPSTFQLVLLDLQLNQFTGKAMSECCAALRAHHAQTLRTLMIGGNEVGDKVAAELGRLIQAAPSLTCVDMRSNRLTARGIEVLAAAIPHSHLTALTMAKNPLHGTPTRRALKSMFADPASALLSIDLCSCSLSSSSIAALCEGLQTNVVLKHLSISQNYAGEEGGEALVALLRTNTHLSQILVADNEIPARVMVQLAEAMETVNTSIRHLVFGGQSTQPPVANEVPSSVRTRIAATLHRNRQHLRPGTSSSHGHAATTALPFPRTTTTSPPLPLTCQASPSLARSPSPEPQVTALLTRHHHQLSTEPSPCFSRSTSSATFFVTNTKAPSSLPGASMMPSASDSRSPSVCYDGLSSVPNSRASTPLPPPPFALPPSSSSLAPTTTSTSTARSSSTLEEGPCHAILPPPPPLPSDLLRQVDGLVMEEQHNSGTLGADDGDLQQQMKARRDRTRSRKNTAIICPASEDHLAVVANNPVDGDRSHHPRPPALNISQLLRQAYIDTHPTELADKQQCPPSNVDDGEEEHPWGSEETNPEAMCHPLPRLGSFIVTSSDALPTTTASAAEVAENTERFIRAAKHLEQHSILIRGPSGAEEGFRLLRPPQATTATSQADLEHPRTTKSATSITGGSPLPPTTANHHGNNPPWSTKQHRWAFPAHPPPPPPPLSSQVVRVGLPAIQHPPPPALGTFSPSAGAVWALQSTLVANTYPPSSSASWGNCSGGSYMPAPAPASQGFHLYPPPPPRPSQPPQQLQHPLPTATASFMKKAATPPSHHYQQSTPPCPSLHPPQQSREQHGSWSKPPTHSPQEQHVDWLTVPAPSSATSGSTAAPLAKRTPPPPPSLPTVTTAMSDFWTPLPEYSMEGPFGNPLQEKAAALAFERRDDQKSQRQHTSVAGTAAAPRATYFHSPFDLPSVF